MKRSGTSTDQLAFSFDPTIADRFEEFHEANPKVYVVLVRLAREWVQHIAGPMTGLPEFNYPAFDAVAAELRARGVDVRCPTELHDGDTSRPYDFYLRLGLRALLDCDEIVLLPGWEQSRGARIECKVAKALGMPVTNWEQAQRWEAGA